MEVHPYSILNRFVIIYSTSCSGIMSPVDEMLERGEEYKGIISRWPCCISISIGHKRASIHGLIINPHFSIRSSFFGTRTRNSFSFQHQLSHCLHGFLYVEYMYVFYFFFKIRNHNNFRSKPCSVYIKGKPHRGARCEICEEVSSPKGKAVDMRRGAEEKRVGSRGNPSAW